SAALVDVYDEPPAEIISLEEENLKAVLEGMHDLTTEGSVSWYFRNCIVDAGAKTGTAQTGREHENGVFVAFAPYDDPEIALAIVIEKGGSGGALAQTAVDILNAYFSSVEDNAAIRGEQTLLP
ncbi:MAG: penicillin-binding protein A, partial [Oscillospiraceae bacterium]|nr:penicillin-binding protein A [Oscillospiraceae bacterium]